MTILKTYYKQPGETLDYTLDYSEWLNKNDTITSSTIVSEPSGLSVSKISSNKGITLIVSGGLDGTLYKLVCTASTYNGLIKEDEFHIRIRDF